MAAQHTRVRADHIEYSFWLTFGRDGGVRLTRGEPGFSVRERAMKMTARLPLTLFSVPSLRAEITIADPGAQAIKIDVDAASKALSQAIGCDVIMTVQEQPTDV